MRCALMAVTARGRALAGGRRRRRPRRTIPPSYISVDELKALLDRKERAIIIDVRTRPEYDALHIAGARSIPLRNMRERAAEVPRSGLVVLY